MWQRHHKEKKLQSLKKLRTCSKKKRNLVFKWDPQTLFCLKRQMNPMKQRQNSVICSFEYGTLNGLRSKWLVQYHIGFFLGGQRGQLPPLDPPYLRPCIICIYIYIYNWMEDGRGTKNIYIYIYIYIMFFNNTLNFKAQLITYI